MPQFWSLLRFAMESKPVSNDATHKGEQPAPQPASAGVDPHTDGLGAGARGGFGRRFGETMSAAHRRVHRPRTHRSDPVWPRRFDRLVLLGLALVFLLSLFDEAATRHARDDQNVLFALMRAITDVGESQWYLVPAALVFFGAAFFDWRAVGFRGRRRLVLLFGQAGFAFAAVALSGLFVNVVKIIVGRARPALLDEFGPHHFAPFSVEYLYASFPSGHATTVGAVTALFCLWFPRLAWLWLALGVFFSATRVVAAAHYLSDIAGGFMIGMAFTVLAARFLARRGTVFRFVHGRIFPAVIGRPATGRR